ncbi:hypothetical protein XENTR_v10004049 [Xenopus tropicalis]|nr:hypothetical protein XENTR_v10004049 [Xenopus tropicalis]
MEPRSMRGCLASVELDLAMGKDKKKKGWHWKHYYTAVIWPVSKRLNVCSNEDLQTEDVGCQICLGRGVYHVN